MTVGSLFYSIILALLGGVVALFVCDKRREAAALLSAFLLSYGLRWALIVVNSSLDILPQKGSTDISLDLLSRPEGIFSVFSGPLIVIFARTEFFIQAFFNFPVYHLIDQTFYSVLFTNAFFGAISGVLIFVYFKKLFNSRVATVGFLLASLYPAAINFSFFGLRDIIQYFFILWNLCAFSWLVLRRDYFALNLLFYGLSFVCVIFARLAFIPFLMVLPGWIVLRWMLSLANRPQRRESRMFVTVVLAVVVPVAGLVAMYAVYIIAINKLHAENAGSIVDVADTIVNSRLSNDTAAFKITGYVPAGHGSGSDILPAAVLRAMPFPIRMVVQVVAMIVLPMPWLLTSPDRIMAGIDSVFVIFVMVWAFRSPWLYPNLYSERFTTPFRDPNSRMRILLWAMFLSFVACGVGMGLFNTNAGNALRLRVSMVPYIIMGGSLFAAYRIKLPALIWQSYDAAAPELTDREAPAE